MKLGASNHNANQEYFMQYADWIFKLGYSDLNTDENCSYDFDIHEDLLYSTTERSFKFWLSFLI